MHHLLAMDMPACMIAVWRHTLMLEMMVSVMALTTRGTRHDHDTMSLVPKYPFVVECMTELVKLCVFLWTMELGA